MKSSNILTTNLLVLLLGQIVAGAGVLCHIEVLRRAQRTFELPRTSTSAELSPIPAYLEKHATFAQAGAFFPDWGYGCLASDDDAEAAHWPPFLGTAIEYLLETYPSISTSSRGQELLSFIFGLASHQNTDATWHSIKMRDGLLKAMAALDFDMDYAAAHSILDTGGDTILAKEYALVRGGDGFEHLKGTWSVPIQDIVNIYDKMGIDLSTIKLRYCMTRGFAALSALRSVGSALATRYQTRSPFMSTQLESHFLGSIGEASTTTVLCWLTIEHWLEKGKVPSSNATWSVCEPMEVIAARGKAGPYSHATAGLAEHSLLHDQRSSMGWSAHEPSLPDDDLFTEFESMIEEEMKYMSSLEDDVTGTLTIKRTSSSNRREILNRYSSSEQTVFRAPYFLTPSLAYGEFGASLAFLDTNDSQNLAIGSPKDTDTSTEPGRGGTYVVALSSQASTLQSTSWDMDPLRSNTIQQQTDSAALHAKTGVEHDTREGVPLDLQSPYFGTSIANITIAGDQCLAVLSYSKVEIFRTINGSMEVNPFMTIVDTVSRGQFLDPPIASHIYTFNFAGHSVLALAAPWSHRSGIVYLFDGSALRAGFNYLGHASLSIRLPFSDSSAHDRLGSAISFSKHHHILFVGCAGRRQVIAYKLSRNLSKISELFRLQDPSSQKLETGFGASGLLAVGNSLFIASSTEDLNNLAQVGIVRLYHITPLYKKNSKRKNAPWTIRIIQQILPQSPTAFSQFGHKVISADIAGHDLLITAPSYHDRGALFYHHNPLKSGKRNLSRGLVPLMISRLLGLVIAQPKLNRTVDVNPCIVGYETSSKFGSAIAVGEAGVVAIGAPMEQGLSSQHRKAGKTYLYDDLKCP